MQGLQQQRHQASRGERENDGEGMGTDGRGAYGVPVHSLVDGMHAEMLCRDKRRKEGCNA